MNHVIKFCGGVMDRNYDFITFISNVFIVRRPKVANFADIKMFIKKTLKDLKKFKRIKNDDLKFNIYLYF